MGVVHVLFGQSDARTRSEAARIAAEDRLLAIHPEERVHLSVFADAQGERNLVFIARLRDLSATFTEKSDRNFYALCILGIMLLLKGVFSFNDVGIFLKALGNAL